MVENIKNENTNDTMKNVIFDSNMSHNTLIIKKMKKSKHMLKIVILADLLAIINGCSSLIDDTIILTL